MELRPHQLVGAKWLARHPARLLGDEVRVGKTPACIHAAFNLLKLERVLVICPAFPRDAQVWAEEQERWAPHAPKFRTLTKLADPIPDVGPVICSYNYARACAADLFIAGRWQLVIFDEFHNLRKTGSQRTQAILGSGGLIERVDRAWFLSGTPICSHAGDLWPVLTVVGATDLDEDQWLRRYCSGYDMSTGFRATGTRQDRIPELRKLLADSGLILRRTQRGVGGFPPMEWEDDEVPLARVDPADVFPTWIPEEIRARIEEQRARMMDLLRGLDPLEALKAESESLSELRLILGLQKVPGFLARIRQELDLDEVEKIIVLHWHRPVGDALVSGLADYGAVAIRGGTSKTARQAAVQAFTNDPACRALVAQVLAAGPGVNLSAHGACRDVASIELSWIPGENGQAFGRPQVMHGPAIRARVFASPDPIDASLMRVLARKSREIKLVLGD